MAVNLPREEWAERIAARLAERRSIDPDPRVITVLTQYEPCEVCGVRVLGVVVHGERRVVEIERLTLDDTVPVGVGRMDICPHACAGRPASRMAVSAGGRP